MTLYRRGNIWWSRIEVHKRVYQFSTKTGNKNTARSVEATLRTEKLKGITGVEAPSRLGRDENDSGIEKWDSDSYCAANVGIRWHAFYRASQAKSGATGRARSES